MYEKFYIPFQFVLFPALKTQKRQGPVPLIRPLSVPAWSYLSTGPVEHFGMRVTAGPATLNCPAAALRT